MIEVYKFLDKQSQQSFFLQNNRLLFEFEQYEITFEFNIINPKDFVVESQYDNLQFSELKKLAEKEVRGCFIGSSEYLGYRVDIIDFNKPISICCRMYEALNIIHKINPTSIESYLLTQNEGYNDDIDATAFCDTEPNYLFEIHISEISYSDSKFFNILFEKLRFNDERYTPPYFYWQFYKRNKEIPDYKRISIPNTNTKVRRLGYFKALGNFLNKYNKIPANFISKKFEKYAEQYEESLNIYKNNKGFIKLTKTGISALPYIETAKDIGFLNLLNTVYSLGKLVKVYQVLKNELKEEESNIFYLTKLDKLFFLETILREDFLYTSLLLELIKMKGNTDYPELVENFQPLILNRLNQMANATWFKKSSKQYREIKRVIERIQKWQKAEVYLEHVLMPRLNWLHDLELIEMGKKPHIELTDAGIKLFNNLCYWNDINWSRIISPHEFLNRFAVHLFDNVYCDTSIKEKSKAPMLEDELKAKITLILKNSFPYFKTLAPNRITASQAITYTKYKLYLTHNIKVEHQFVVNFLKSPEQNIFVYKYQKQYDDGYIQKIIK